MESLADALNQEESLFLVLRLRKLNRQAPGSGSGDGKASGGGSDRGGGGAGGGTSPETNEQGSDGQPRPFAPCAIDVLRPSIGHLQGYETEANANGLEGHGPVCHKPPPRN